MALAARARAREASGVFARERPHRRSGDGTMAQWHHGTTAPATKHYQLTIDW
jgi:hypothetical protein